MSKEKKDSAEEPKKNEIKSFSEVKFNKNDGEFLNDPNLVFMDEILKERGVETLGLRIYENLGQVFSSVNDLDDFPLSSMLDFYNANPNFYWEEVDNAEMKETVYNIVDEQLKTRETNLLEKLGITSVSEIEKVLSVSPNEEDSMPFLLVLTTKDFSRNLLVIINFKWTDSEDDMEDFDKQTFEHQIVTKEEYDNAQAKAGEPAVEEDSSGSASS